MAPKSRAGRNKGAGSAAWSIVLGVLGVAAAWLAAAAPGAVETDAPAAGPAPNFALTTQQNDRLWLTHLRGRAVVLAFGCTGCGACPELVPRLADVARSLGDAPGRAVHFLLVTVDPGRDTPTRFREFGAARGLRAPAWILLTEDRPGEVDVVARRYGVRVNRAAGRVDADCVATLIDQRGRIRARYERESFDALEKDVRRVLGLPTSP
ncbi:MAG TPA: SCO family protein [Methylomirabilota bacterium]|nr:SCO family protein [Methylomirabilota bacterium]